MKKIRIRLAIGHGNHVWLVENYFPTGNMLHDYYLTANMPWASDFPLEEARKWMREAKHIAILNNIHVTKGEYIYDGKPTPLKNIA